MKNLVVFTGAGISQESGIPTFRDNEGLWSQYNPEVYASASGWTFKKEKLNEFYNLLRSKLKECKPNKAHYLLKDLEKFYNVTIITQNIDDLHERAGSNEVIHLHGELTKIRPDPDIFYKKLGDTSHWKDIGYEPLDNSKLNEYRPAIILFGESVPLISTAIEKVKLSDIFVVIGTSLEVYPAASLTQFTPKNIVKYLIDPKFNDFNQIDENIYIPEYTYIKENASKGVQILFDDLVKTL